MQGGVLAVAQFGGPSAVINASLAGVIREAQRQHSISGIYGLQHGLEGALAEQILDLTATPAATLDQLVHTPAAALGSSRHKLTDADYQRVIDVLRVHGVSYLVFVGGNGSMHAGHRLAELAAAAGYDLRVAGVPKTIDNDLFGTDHAPGYGSAARFLALATRDTGRDLEAMATFDDVTLLEAMGRNTGWLAAASALAKFDEDDAPHLVYVPEIPFNETHFLDAVADVHARLRRVFIVIGEGIRDEAGQFVGNPLGAESQDPLGRMVHSLAVGAPFYLADLIRARLGLQARVLRPGLIGRALSTCVSAPDRTEAEHVGVEAVRQVAAGRAGIMITLERLSSTPYLCAPGTIPLAQVGASREKPLPRAYMNAAGTLPSPEFHHYALPLIGTPPEPLPRLAGASIARRLFTR
ncbi:MAG: diphosphate--fructose-6-phosphate 1-phosphotransferase [Chloroflexi bacterium]|nr:diphosphate--fructose-6-phosphate 1-phosphotransferase [Chloroflexota bacterium]